MYTCVCVWESVYRYLFFNWYHYNRQQLVHYKLVHNAISNIIKHLILLWFNNCWCSYRYRIVDEHANSYSSERKESICIMKSNLLIPIMNLEFNIFLQNQSTYIYVKLSCIKRICVQILNADILKISQMQFPPIYHKIYVFTANNLHWSETEKLGIPSATQLMMATPSTIVKLLPLVHQDPVI